MSWKQQNAARSAPVKALARRTAAEPPAAATAVADVPAAHRRTERLTISRAAAEAGVHIETIRFYEREGLIAQPPRPSSGYRAYSSELVRRVQFIRQCQELGFSLKETREFLRISDENTDGCTEACVRVESKIVELTEKIASLDRLRLSLKSLVGDCPQGHCKVLEALDPRAGCGHGSQA